MREGQTIAGPVSSPARRHPVGGLTDCGPAPHSMAMYDFPELAVYATDRFVLVCMALFVEAVIGRALWVFRVLPHPVAMFRACAGFLERRLNRSRRGPRALVVRGAIVTAVLCIAGGLIGGSLEAWAATFPAGWVLDLAVVSLVVSQRGGYGEASRTVRALTRDGVAAAREQVARYHKGQPSALDAHGISRALSEHLAAEFGRWLVAPVFWYLIFGLPALLIYVAIVVAAERFGGDEAARAGFGWTAVRLEKFAGWIPGRIAGMLVVLACFLAPTARPIRAFRIMWRKAAALPSASFGWPAAAFAGALSVELGGANSAEGRPMPWFGDGTARMTARDAHRALLLFGYACVVHASILAVLAAVRVATV